MDFVKCSGLNFNYIKYYDGQKIQINALKNINLSVKKGEFAAFLGHNGSGKSTLAKLLNALVLPPKNTVFVGGLDAADSKNIWDIRKRAGMVFQNPDNQLISSIVEDDVAFGCENLGIPSEQIRESVDYSLKKVGMTKYKNAIVSELSGGQKQRVAIAGILAMKPECIIFDEATSMLDPMGRRAVMDIALELNSEGITIIFITHYMEEALKAHKIFVLNEGSVVMEGAPKEIFSDYDKIIKYNLDIPQVTELGKRLGIKNVYEPQELADAIGKKNIHSIKFEKEQYINNNETILKIENLSYTYKNGKRAVDNVSAEIKKGELICLIGQTGCGKSTFVQLLNGIYKASRGEIYFKGKNIRDCKNITQKIGLVFQYPEDQIFEATVFDEAAFAPKNMKLSKEEIFKRVKNALDFVNIDKSCYDKSPFELSGGERRRLAIAGILAMEPDILVFDEPMAGLDPKGRKEILKKIKALTDRTVTVILVSHSMEETAEIADRVIVMEDGRFKYFDTPYNVFKHKDLSNMGLDVPKITQVFNIINKEKEILPYACNIEDAEIILKKALSL